MNDEVIKEDKKPPLKHADEVIILCDVITRALSAVVILTSMIQINKVRDIHMQV